MQINKKIASFLVFESESVLTALRKINDNQKRIVFVVSENGRLRGALSDGDFRRWLTNIDGFDLSVEVSSIMNKEVIFANVNQNRIEIEEKFKKSVELVPLVDEYRRVVAIANKSDRGIYIGNRLISEEMPTFIIAEIGNNHNGDINLAKQLVDLAKASGADCVKFQMRNLEDLYSSDFKQKSAKDLGVEYTYDVLSKYQLTNDQLIEVFEYSKRKDIIPLCTPWDIESFKLLSEYGLDAYKVASADFTNHQLLEVIISVGKPLLCSTGMSTESEIAATVKFLKAKAAEFLLLHCNSTYPTPFKDINLSYLANLKKVSSCIVGYSGHERGYSVPIAAVALGAKVIEKHFTLDKTMEGNDHKVSLLPDEFKAMVGAIREVEASLGSKADRSLSQGEMINREVLAKSLICSRSIRKGDVITRDIVEIKSPGQGLQPIYLDNLIGKNANRDIDSGDFFYESDLQEFVVKNRNYNFQKKFGIPVRFHDYKLLVNKSNFDLVEFHLSYQDMELDPAKHIDNNKNLGFLVHSPELFSGDHLLNLASDDQRYVDRSIQELNNVVKLTKKINTLFENEKKPRIIINAGGFSNDKFVTRNEKKQMYDNVVRALNKIDKDNIEIIIQTMPPFPWHFGGQRFHNLFIDPEEIVDFCDKNNTRICLDVSHSMMACNYYKWDFDKFIDTVNSYISHIHIVDAKGVDGEGVEIGKGDIDFQALANKISKMDSRVTFIPEIWQGHKNNGEGFWKALDYLEAMKF